MLNSCCGRYSLRTGCIVIGLVLVVIGCLEMIPADNVRFVGIIEVICSALLLIGIRLDEKKRMVPCMIIRALYVAGGTLVPIVNMPQGEGVMFVAFSFSLAAINLYVLVVLYSYYANSNQHSSNTENTVMENDEHTTQPTMVIVQDRKLAYSRQGDLGQSEQFFAQQTTYAACDMRQS